MHKTLMKLTPGRKMLVNLTTGGERGLRLRGVHQDSLPEWNFVPHGISQMIIEFY